MQPYDYDKHMISTVSYWSQFASLFIFYSKHGMQLSTFTNLLYPSTHSASTWMSTSILCYLILFFKYIFL